MNNQNLDIFKQQVQAMSSDRHTWTIGINQAPDGTYYYLAIEDGKDRLNIVELKPDKNNPNVHTIRLHTENYDVKNMNGLDAGELATALQLSTIMLMSIDYGYTPKSK